MKNKLFVLGILSIGSLLAVSASYSGDDNFHQKWRETRLRTQSFKDALQDCDGVCFSAYESHFGYNERQKLIKDCVAACLQFRSVSEDLKKK